MNSHYLSQVFRFGRLFGAAFLTSWAATGNSIRKDVVVGAIVGAIEVAYREMSPVA